MLVMSIFVKQTTAVFIGETFFFCSRSMPLKLWNLGVSLFLLLDLLRDFVGVFSLESVPESVSKFRSFRELLQLSVSAMRLARLLRARLEVEEVVWTLAHECVEDGVPGWLFRCGVAGVDTEPEHFDSGQYLV